MTFDDLLTDDAEVLFDESTTTTRWVVWRQVTTGILSLALVQKQQVVSVQIDNLLVFCARKLPPILAANAEAVPPKVAVRFGNESPGDQFFVLKYKDKFACAALRAYAVAVDEHASALWLEGKHDECLEFREFASEIHDEADKAEAAASKTPTPLRSNATSERPTTLDNATKDAGSSARSAD